MNGILFMKIFITIFMIAFAAVSIWGVLEFIKPLSENKK